MSVSADTRENVLGVYRKRARHYDRTARLYSLFGYRMQNHRRRAVQALQLRPGDTVVEIGCGTGLNFALIEEQIGPEGRIVGVDLTDAMLAQARRRVEELGWENVSLVQADAVEFDFPTEANAVLSTYALSFEPECAEVIARACQRLSPGGRCVVLDGKVPDNTPGWLVRFGLAVQRPFGVSEEWVARRPWEGIHEAMDANLSGLSWTEEFFGLMYLAAGVRARDGR